MSPPAWPALVLVEGLPGSGKSTTAQWLAHEMGCQGRPARWVYEQEVPHPVFGAGRMPQGSWKERLGHRLAGWARFAAGVRGSGTTTVLDSAFLQTSVFSTLRRGLPPDAIVLFVERVADIIRPLDPVLVHFLEPDPEAALRRICERRGMAWTLQMIAMTDAAPWARARGASGLDGSLAYWREHAGICATAAVRSALRRVAVDERTGDWPARRRLIADFLGLARLPSTAPAEIDLARFAGRYRGESRREMRLSVRDGALVTDGFLWPSNRLLPRAPAAFDVESWPFRLIFDTDPSGAVLRFRLDGPDLPWTRVSGTYEKLQ